MATGSSAAQPPARASAARRKLSRLHPWRRGKDAKPRSPWARGRVLAALAVLIAGLLAFHSAVPNTAVRLGSLLEAFLPWLGLAVPVLLGLALLRRSALALVALLLPAAVWAGLFGGLLLGEGRTPYDFLVVQHNVSDENADPAGTAAALVDSAPDLIALEELTPVALPAYERALESAYPFHAVRGSVGLWSAYPLSDVRTVDIKPKGIGDGWSRGLRSTVRTPRGDLAVYVAHLPSVRIGPRGFGSDRRDESAHLLGEALGAEKLDTVVLLGDLNSTLDDRGLAPVTSRLTSAEQGFSFSWPAGFPVSRIDHVMARSATVTDVWTLNATGSDHLPVAAGIDWEPER